MYRQAGLCGCSLFWDRDSAWICSRVHEIKDFTATRPQWFLEVRNDLGRLQFWRSPEIGGSPKSSISRWVFPLQSNRLLGYPQDYGKPSDSLFFDLIAALPKAEDHGQAQSSHPSYDGLSQNGDWTNISDMSHLLAVGTKCISNED